METRIESAVAEGEVAARRSRIPDVIAVGLFVVLVGVVWVQVAQGRTEERIIGQADDIALKQADLEAMLDGLDPETRDRVLKDTPTLSTIVRRELGRRLLEQRALAEGWDKRDDVQARLERLRLEFIATSYLESQAMPPEAFPSDTEVETAYHLNQQRFLVPRQFKLAQVYLARPAEASAVDGARAAAKDLAGELRKRPTQFARIAREKSADKASAANGGELGWLREDQIQPEIRAVVKGLASGDVSEPIETADGWHILRLAETKPAAVAPLADVRDSLVATLRQQRAQENAAAFLSKLLADRQATVDEITLAKVQKDLQ